MPSSSSASRTVVLEAERQEVRAELRADQVLGGQVDDRALLAARGSVARRADPAMQQAIAHGVREREVVIVASSRRPETSRARRTASRSDRAQAPRDRPPPGYSELGVCRLVEPDDDLLTGDQIGRRSRLTSLATAFANVAASGGDSTQPFSFAIACRVFSTAATEPARCDERLSRSPRRAPS